MVRANDEVAAVLQEHADLISVDALEKAIRGGKLAGLRGFGARTEDNLLHGIELLHKTGQHARLSLRRMPVAQAGTEAHR